MDDTFTFCTVSMGRLHHLVQTLPALAAEGPVALCDWSCPDKSGKWAATLPNVSVVGVPHHQSLIIAAARNCAARIAQTNWLAFIDCDVKVPVGFGRRIKALLEPGTLLWFAKEVAGLAGFIVCEKRAWESIGGYPADHRGYGYEDAYFRRCLFARGVREKVISDEGVEHIEHDHVDRVRFYEDKNPASSWERNKRIFESKFAEFVRSQR